MLAVFWALKKKCIHSDFGIVPYAQEGSPPHSKCLLLLIVLLLVGKHDIDHCNLLFRTYGASKMAWKPKNPY